MTLSLLGNGAFQEGVITVGLIAIGFFSKVLHGVFTNKSSSNITEALTNDYKALKEMYTTQIDDNKRLKGEIETLTRESLQLRARIVSYESMLMNRTPETEQALRVLPIFMKQVEEKLGLTLPEIEPLNGKEAAHSQAKA